ncbi:MULTISPECIES: SchA/CurD-like domain-containing protein [Streptomyces]|uniref:SchA/CurD-like domain-containing protein n=1 Tax=Streptomyces TaxID=1883 RepID=UPI001E3C954B|nr:MULTISPECIES: SchA/CurD-like domain-containing protein [Streptomyces]UFQ18599.1 SchA/CurD [Streptomyces huasconensis]WCL88214.1 SchA/CurD-like domain-containing protein [Streptomyces sp. JCM 35825]
MPYAAISYRIKPERVEEVAELFAGFQRVNTPVFTDDDGKEVGRLLGTAVFVQDDVLVRVIHYEGDFAQIGRHMGAQKGVHILEEKLAPHLAEARETDTRTVDGFTSHFRSSVMRCVSQLSIDTHPQTQGQN